MDPDNILNGILDDSYKELMRYQITRARFYYKQAARGIPMLAPQARLPVQVSRPALWITLTRWVNRVLWTEKGNVKNP